jgi:hypothetical protein
LPSPSSSPSQPTDPPDVPTFDAIDSDDVQRAASLMKKARVDASTIAAVIKKREGGDGEH